MPAAINGGTNGLRRSHEKPSTPIPAHAAESRSLPMETATANIAAMPAISRIASKETCRMTKQEFENEKKYLQAVSIAKSLLDQKLLTPEEYSVIDTKLREKYGAKFSALICE